MKLKAVDVSDLLGAPDIWALNNPVNIALHCCCCRPFCILSAAAVFTPLSLSSRPSLHSYCLLLHQGYAVIDNVFGSDTTAQLKQELLSVYSQGLMHMNHTHLVNKGATKLLKKSQIHEAELTLDPSIQQAAPLISQLNTDRTLATMLSLHVPQLRLESQAIKMQHNKGMHFITTPRSNSTKHLSLWLTYG
jgi:hypothetical protein